ILLRPQDPIDHKGRARIKHKRECPICRGIVIILVDECRFAELAEKFQSFARGSRAYLILPGTERPMIWVSNNQVNVQIADIIGVVSAITPCQPGGDETVVIG